SGCRARARWSDRVMLVLSLINFKGGVGKTTLAVNLAAALGHGDRRVLLVDADPQMSATGSLVADPAGILKSGRTLPNLIATHLAGRSIQPKRWVQTIASKNESHTFDLLAGDGRPNRLEQKLHGKP